MSENAVKWLVTYTVAYGISKNRFEVNRISMELNLMKVEWK